MKESTLEGLTQRLDRLERQILNWAGPISGLLALAILTAGCAAETYREFSGGPIIPAGVKPNDGIAVVLREFSGKFSPEKEGELAECITMAIRNVRPPLRLVPAEEFRRTVFPGSSPGSIALTSWESLAKEAAFHERIAPLGLRYLILLQGSTETKDSGSMVSTVGAGYFYSTKVSSVEAMIFDLTDGALVANYGVVVRGEQRLYMSAILPVWFQVAYTESEACREAGKVVSDYLAGERLP